MHTFLEKNKKKDQQTLIFFIAFFLFGALLLTYYFWGKNQNTATDNTTVQLTPNTQTQLSEEELQRRLQAMGRQPVSPPPLPEAIFKCIKPRRFQYTTPSNTKPQQQGQITVIPDIRIEIKKCDDYYNPKIRRIIQIGTISDDYLKRQLAKLQENKERCLRAAKKGGAIIY